MSNIPVAELFQKTHLQVPLARLLATRPPLFETSNGGILSLRCRRLLMSTIEQMIFQSAIM
jgi:hypothetical protein